MNEQKRQVRDSSDKRISLVDKRRSTPEGLRDSNAVRSTFDAANLIFEAMEQSNTSRDELADKLEVSRERVDEILDALEGNVRVSTLARILTVCGFSLSISSKKIDEN